MVPYYLKHHLKNITHQGVHTSGLVVSSTGNDSLRIKYYGELRWIGGKSYIGTGDAPCLIVAQDPLTDEEILIFDANRHGYDALFCDPPMTDADRPLTSGAFPITQIAVTFEYAIDYDSEKDDYEFDENQNIKLVDGSFMDYETAKSIGYSWITMTLVETGETILDMELA